MPDQPHTPVTGSVATRPLRLGMHGSPHLARSILAKAGLLPGEAELVPYDVRDPFGPLRARQVDVMIVKYTLQEPDIAFSRPVALDTRAVIVGAGHPLAARESVSLEDVAGYDAFERPGDFPPNVWDLVVPRTTPGGRPIRRVHPMTTLAAMAAVLADGRSVHVSFLSLADALPPGTVAVPVHDLPPAPVALAWLRGEAQPAAVTRLVSGAEQEESR
ncbi:LysR substrate-binding domain-containing protein [Kitasatospora sp. NPDC048239]|uniref:LysR substrate-binding domain-containing protein n=1 Tax=Kitasatospora sp. NPDC048239 TaxID=3364046 RepID=UPI00371226EA